jgi:predicted transcriptional regulator
LEELMATDAPPLTDKQIAAEALGRMPEAATLAEISERLAILAGLRRGQQDIDEGRAVSHEEAKRRSTAWTGK